MSRSPKINFLRLCYAASKQRRAAAPQARPWSVCNHLMPDDAVLTICNILIPTKFRQMVYIIFMENTNEAIQCAHNIAVNIFVDSFCENILYVWDVQGTSQASRESGGVCFRKNCVNRHLVLIFFQASILHLPRVYTW